MSELTLIPSASAIIDHTRKLNTTYEVWRGPAMDGTPVVLLATGILRKSENSKTGPMIQTFILRQDMKPIEAVNTGADVAICGDCPFRPIIAKQTGDASCYVTTWMLTRLWESWRAGRVPVIGADELGIIANDLGMGIRHGAYGDPAHVPVSIWAALGNNRGTSYTHQWRVADIGLAQFAMASVQSVAEASEAHAAGWRTYRVDKENLGAGDGEIMCPEQTRGVQCKDCGLCAGNRIQAKNIVITPIDKRSKKQRAA